MSSEDSVISVRNLSKSYHLYDRPGDRLKQFLLPRFQRFAGRTPRQYFHEFHALRDVSFEIRSGEAVGIVGRNGSGKSTLLQLICGTAFPSSGSVATRGRIAALLELGAGFNPEFSGRANIRLNASLLGLTSEQIDERFDSIAAFADIGEHLDQPIKTYSSGMFVRVAFAVIAHFDADVLVVDEALAVGDAIFTQRCMRFIRRFLEHGTLLFVSHDTSSVRNLCTRALWIDQGRLRADGAPVLVTDEYLRFSLQALYGEGVELRSLDGTDSIVPEPALMPAGIDETSQSIPALPDSDRVGEGLAPTPLATNSPDDRLVQPWIVAQAQLDSARGFEAGGARLTRLELSTLSRSAKPVLEGGERVVMKIRAQALQRLERPILGFIVRDRLGQDLFGENTLVRGIPAAAEAGQSIEAEFEFDLPMLPNGEYPVMASVADGDLHDHVQHHYLHDAMVLRVSTSRVRWGLVGIPFRRVHLQIDNG